LCSLPVRFAKKKKKISVLFIEGQKIMIYLLKKMISVLAKQHATLTNICFTSVVLQLCSQNFRRLFLSVDKGEVP
jgi:hypothetical protein